MKKIFYLLILILISAMVSADNIETSMPTSNNDVGFKQTSLGTIVTDAIRVYSSSDIALVAATDLKKIDTIPAGATDTQLIINALAYPDDSITVLKLSGKMITRAFNKSLFIYPTSYMGFLQVSGATVTFNPKKGLKDKVVSIKIKGANIEESKVYTVAMPSSLANGANGYWRIWQKDTEKIQSAVTIVKAIGSYFEKNKKVNNSPQNRIVAEDKK